MLDSKKENYALDVAKLMKVMPAQQFAFLREQFKIKPFYFHAHAIVLK